MGGGGGGDGGDRSPANFLAFNIMPMGIPWKESISNGLRPPNRRAVVPPLPGGAVPRKMMSARVRMAAGRVSFASTIIQ